MRKWLIRFLGLSESKIISPPDPWLSADFDESEWEIIRSAKNFTMTSQERLISLIRATKYISANGIAGDVVECGVWRGGSAMAMALSLKQLGDQSRQLYLYDTYEGMSAPSEVDESFDGEKADEQLKRSDKKVADSVWCYSTLDEVKTNMAGTGYPVANLRFIQGKVEDTIPNDIPEKIALLRLDTDWYESTKHEMKHLFPRLQKGGILIIDDYGHWKGCRQAVDEYIKENNLMIFLARVDYTCRIAVKL